MKKKILLAMLEILLALMAACGQGKEPRILLEGGAEEILSREETEENKEPEGKEKSTQEEGGRTEEAQERKPVIWVDVSGAVKEPGVYQLLEGARVFEAIEAAGGFAESADTELLNQAAVVSDGEKLLVYTKEEAESLRQQGISAASAKAGKGAENGTENAAASPKININTASAQELQEIPGIGETRAAAILSYREENGGFHSIEEIQEVSGIKGKTFEKIEAYITVE